MASSVINSDDGVVSGTSGLKSSGGDDGVTVFQQNGTEAMRVTSGGTVGIGTASPTTNYLLHVDGDSSSDGRIARFSQAGITTAIVDVTAQNGTDTEAFTRYRNDATFYSVGIDSSDSFAIGQSFANTIGTKRFAIDTSGNLQFNSGYGSVATAYGVRVWVDFNGTGTVAIRGSGNVSSITDNNTGDYTVNFTTALPDANYAVSGSFGNNSAVFLRRSSTSPGTSSSAMRFISLSDSGNATDYEVENIIIVR
jgi:hypothetical protein